MGKQTTKATGFNLRVPDGGHCMHCSESPHPLPARQQQSAKDNKLDILSVHLEPETLPKQYFLRIAE